MEHGDVTEMFKDTSNAPQVKRNFLEYIQDIPKTLIPLLNTKLALRNAHTTG